MKQVETLLRSHLDAICRDHGLSTMQYVALSVLRVHPGTSSAELAERSFVSAQSANQMVAALERQGMIERAPDERNRRILRIQLTVGGHAAVSACDAVVDKLEEAMFAGMTPSDQDALRATLTHCIRNLRDERPRGAGAGAQQGRAVPTQGTARAGAWPG